MQYLYISSLISKNLMAEIRSKTGKEPSFAVQKFSRLIVNGFVGNGAEIDTLSTVPYGTIVKKGIISRFHSEIEDNIHYTYIPTIGFSLLRNLSQFIYTFFKVLFWGLPNRPNKCIIGDVLNVSIGMGSLLAARIIGIKAVGVVTDIPSLMLRGGRKRTTRLRIADAITNFFIHRYTDYIFLTEAMNQKVNIHNRPYMIMEGLADSDLLSKPLIDVVKVTPRKVMYAGGLHERYGLKILVEAFIKLPFNDIQLLIYGMGPFAEDLKKYARKDNRIVYGGIISNEEIVRKEQSAYILVNPRPTHEDFTKYSFPSKNIEYMASGTPLLTTRLPGMPIDYYPYIYLFKNEDVNGYYTALWEVLSLPATDLQNKGMSARKFIADHKNNLYQTKRIIDFIEQTNEYK